MGTWHGSGPCDPGSMVNAYICIAYNAAINKAAMMLYIMYPFGDL